MKYFILFVLTISLLKILLRSMEKSGLLSIEYKKGIHRLRVLIGISCLSISLGLFPVLVFMSDKHCDIHGVSLLLCLLFVYGIIGLLTELRLDKVLNSIVAPNHVHSIRRFIKTILNLSWFVCTVLLLILSSKHTI